MSGVPAAYRLCYQNEDSNAPMEEVVLAMQGILIDESLPPVEQKKKVPRNPYFAQQMVVLSGYGTPGFEQCEHAITLIDEKLQMSLKEEAFNPYFTIRNLNTRAIPLQFSPGVDPKGFLLDAGGQTLVHLDDNVVEYFAKQETIIGNEKIERFNSVKPDEFRFRTGLLVEIQMSFLIRKVNGGFKMFKVLRSIAMLSDCHLLNANALYQASLNSAKQPRTQSLKCRLAYDEEVLYG
ncbi:hypothetical protein BD410DRAFT_809776 [Rickenella mellea]|uniref:Uncharacterized protein n=1 Tax=Rickenella mellea TaxID=50990 RepID=A0A4Y7PG20_9AGAM|nr:hypothetical protein BD410DRAFT_809776 [Rickenella mellea]